MEGSGSSYNKVKGWDVEFEQEVEVSILATRDRVSLGDDFITFDRRDLLLALDGKPIEDCSCGKEDHGDIQ